MEFEDSSISSSFFFIYIYTFLLHSKRMETENKEDSVCNMHIRTKYFFQRFCKLFSIFFIFSFVPTTQTVYYKKHFVF